MKKTKFTESFSERTFFRALSNDHCHETSVENMRPARYLFNYLKDSGAKTILTEQDYVDRDYLEDFAEFYVRCFNNYKSKCDRLHFFSCDLSDAILKKLVLNTLSIEEVDEVRKSYLGFIVSRPLPSAVVGRTVIRPKKESGRSHYPCVIDYKSNIFGIEFNLSSLVYQEQDTVLSACATVALWSCFHRTKDAFGSLSPSPSGVTKLATEVAYSSRPIPSHGLNIHQMCRAIRGVGLEPDVFEVKQNQAFPTLLYAYLKEGHPVILGIDIELNGLHAVLATGYELENKPFLAKEVKEPRISPPMIGRRISKIFVHDDQMGPFAPSNVSVGTDYKNQYFPIALSGTWKDDVTGKDFFQYPIVAIAPVYHKVRLTFVDIQKWMKPISDVLTIFNRAGYFEWEPWLTSVTNLKRELRNSPLPTLSPQDRENLLYSAQPRFIWRAILRVDGDEVFEFLADATDMDRSCPIYKCIWHDENFRNGFKHLEDTAKSNTNIETYLDTMIRPSLRAKMLS